MWVLDELQSSFKHIPASSDNLDFSYDINGSIYKETDKIETKKEYSYNQSVSIQKKYIFVSWIKMQIAVILFSTKLNWLYHENIFSIAEFFTDHLQIWICGYRMNCSPLLNIFWLPQIILTSPMIWLDLFIKKQVK